jgi:hypothetical protein
LKVKVSMDLTLGSSGDNIYKACGSTATTTEFIASEGLFNVSLLKDLNNNVIQKDTACGDLPYISHEKTLVSITDLGNNKSSVVYKIDVKNTGGVATTYSLQDVGSFDNDIELLSGSYSSVEIGAYAFTGNPFPLTIVTNNSINPGQTKTYQVVFEVKIDLTPGSSGDNIYKACGITAGPNKLTAGEGLFNESILKDSKGVVIQKDTACGDLPFIEHTKTLATITSLGNNKFDVVYNIVVKNTGGAAGKYGLSDQPTFDDDIKIEDVSYTNTAGVPAISISPTGPFPWPLSSGVSLGAGLSHTYALKVKVSMDLSSGSSGDNIYKACGKTSGTNTFTAGEGLFNVSLLKDLNSNIIAKDTACGDLPFIEHTKTLATITPLGNNKYDVTYDIVVKNTGGTAGIYGLSDQPTFDDDIKIEDVSYTNTAGVPAISISPIAPYSWPLSSGVSLGAGLSHTYTLKVKVSIDLSTSSAGDNIYKACGKTVGPNTFTAGEGLFNVSSLKDLNNNVIAKDTACGDLPYITHEKTLSNITPLGENKYKVKYEIKVENKGGTSTKYSLEDAAKFEDDIEILGGEFSSPETGVAIFTGNGFPITLTTNNTILAGTSETYTVIVDVKIDLTPGSSGDNIYKACGMTAGPNKFTAGEGLFNESILKDSEGLVIQKDTACGDLPFIEHTKTLATITPLGNNKFDVVYNILVKNTGGASGKYGLSDQPTFDDDIKIEDVSYTNTAGVPAISISPTGPFPWPLSSGVTLGAGLSHTYALKVKVSIDLTPGSSGDNIYKACGKTAGPNKFTSGEGLFNVSFLKDLNSNVIAKDTACGDLPFIEHTKVVSKRTQISRDEYAIEYTIKVENKGGASGIYGLSDLPGFDDDIEILSSSYTNTASVTPNVLNPNGPFPWKLSEGVNLAAGTSHTYVLNVGIKINLTAGSGGDNIYNQCGISSNNNGYTKGEGLFNESLLLDLVDSSNKCNTC